VRSIACLNREILQSYVTREKISCKQKHMFRIIYTNITGVLRDLYSIKMARKRYGGV